MPVNSVYLPLAAGVPTLDQFVQQKIDAGQAAQSAKNLSPAVQSLLGPQTTSDLQAAQPQNLQGLNQISPVAVQNFGLANAQQIIAAGALQAGNITAAGETAAGNLIATGAAQEASAYSSAQAISDQNARLALVSGGIQTVQQQRLLQQTVGGIRADIAGSGLQNAGNAAFLLRDSLRQGMLESQLIGTQAQITAGGYQQQSAAAAIEAAAAQMSAGVAENTAATSAATALSTSQTEATSALNTASTEANAATQLAQTANAAGVIAQTQGVNAGVTAASGGTNFKVVGAGSKQQDQFIWGPPTGPTPAAPVDQPGPALYNTGAPSSGQNFPTIGQPSTGSTSTGNTTTVNPAGSTSVGGTVTGVPAGSDVPAGTDFSC